MGYDFVQTIINVIFYHSPLFYLIQSIWRDEAFSYFMSRSSLIQVVINTSNDFNPPLYYLFLHFWIGIVGKTDEGLRILSLLFHLASVYISYLIGVKIFNKRFAKFVSVFVLLNPMLIYYAFEIRMYSLYVLLTFLTFYFFIDREWKKFILAAALGLYTHSFFPLLIGSLAVYELLIKKSDIKILLKIFFPFILYLPWIPIIITQFIKSESSWLFPVDLRLILSSLGNIFTNYDGTPWNGWILTQALSLVIVLFLTIGFIKKKKQSLVFLLPIFLPLFFVLFFSVIKRPLYVNRYLIFITVFEILGIAQGIFLIKSKLVKRLSIFFWIAVIIGINLYLPPYKKKADFKSTFTEINKIATDADYAYAKTPIGLLETAYYFKNENRTFIYNPNNVQIPNYIGVTVVFPESSQVSFPAPPSRTFLLDDTANYEVVITQ